MNLANEPQVPTEVVNLVVRLLPGFVDLVTYEMVSWNFPFALSRLLEVRFT